MPSSSKNSPLSASAIGSGIVLSAWLLACDAWIKVLARSGACPEVGTLSDALGVLWSPTEGCSSLSVAGVAALEPRVRAGILPLDIGLPDGLGPVWGLALFALAAVTTILVLRWQRRSWGDALALSTLWSGVAMHGLPRLVGDGVSFSELTLGSIGLGLGDLTIGWACLWLVWRTIAELRG